MLKMLNIYALKLNCMLPVCMCINGQKRCFQYKIKTFSDVFIIIVNPSVLLPGKPHTNLFDLRVSFTVSGIFSSYEEEVSPVI